MSIYLRGSTYWYSFMVKRKSYRGSCKTSDPKQAQEYHDRLKAEAWRGRLLNDKPRYKLSEAIERYVKDNGDKKSIRDDIRSANWWNEQFASAKITFIDELTAEQIRDIRDDELGRPGKKGPIKPATVDRKLAFLRSVLRAAKLKWEWVEDVPFVELYNEEEERERYLEPHEVERLVKALPEPFNYMALLAVATGLRQGNVFQLKWSEVNLVGRYIRLPGVRMKNGNPFSVALNETAMTVIRAQIGKHTEYVFPKEDGTPHMWLPSDMWKKVLQDAGLENVRWHDLRHTWASLMRQSGVALADLQEMGGWKSERMVQRYAHLDVSHLHQKAAVMDRVLSPKPDGVRYLHSV